MLYSSGEKPFGFATRSVPMALPLLADLTRSSNKTKAAYCKNRGWNNNVCGTSCRKSGSSLVLVQELEQALALVLELALDQGLGLELGLDQGLELEFDLD